jgi:hypothetical protein
VTPRTAAQLPPVERWRLKNTQQIVDVVRITTNDDRRALRESDWATRPRSVLILSYKRADAVLFVNDTPVVPGDYVLRFADGTLDTVPAVVLNSIYERIETP